MSNNGRPDRGQTAALAEILNPKWVLRHRGSTPDFIRRYRAWAGKAAASKLAGLRKAAPHLLEFISDERTLYTALKHMEAEGSHAPGPDQLRYEDIALIGDWKWCRATRDEIRDGEYVPGAEKLQKIPKGPGRGFRELVVQSVQERVIHRAVVEVLTRVAAWLHTLAERSATVLAITHPAVVRAAIATALGSGPAAFRRIDVGPLTRARLSHTNGIWTLAALLPPKASP